MHKLPRLAFALLVAVGLPLWVSAQQKPEPKGEDVVERMMRSTCFLVVEHPDRINGNQIPVTRGSGSLIINTRGKKVVLTNYHVVGKYDDVCVMFPIRKPNGDLIAEPKYYIDNRNNPQYAIKGKVIDRLKDKDLALVELQAPELPKHLRPFVLADKAPKQASTTHTMGNPAASGMWSYTKGEVRTVYEVTRSFPIGTETIRVAAKVVDTSNPLSGGDSGGPLVNDSNELVGVVQSIATQASSLASSISVDEVWLFLKKNKLDRLAASSGRATASIKEDAPKPEKPTATQPEKTVMSEDDKKAQQERYAAAKLKQAKQLPKAERREFLEEIIEKYATTKAAAEAKELLKDT